MKTHSRSLTTIFILLLSLVFNSFIFAQSIDEVRQRITMKVKEKVKKEGGFKRINKVRVLDIDTLIVRINYNTIQEAIGSGNYDKVDKWIKNNKTNFSLQDSVAGEAVTILLVQFGVALNTNRVLALLKKLGLQEALIDHLLAIGEQYPELQKEDSDISFVALGSKDRKGYHVPILSTRVDESEVKKIEHDLSGKIIDGELEMDDIDDEEVKEIIKEKAFKRELMLGTIDGNWSPLAFFIAYESE